MWAFNSSSGLWTWLGGSTSTSAPGLYGAKGVASAANFPGARSAPAAASSTASSGAGGALWLFGGMGFPGEGPFGAHALGAGCALLCARSPRSAGWLNDLWTFDVAAGTWTWLTGSSVASARGQYGSRGIETTGSTPGARSGAAAWCDINGNVWMFGGYGFPAASFGAPSARAKPPPLTCTLRAQAG